MSFDIEGSRTEERTASMNTAIFGFKKAMKKPSMKPSLFPSESMISFYLLASFLFPDIVGIIHQQFALLVLVDGFPLDDYQTRNHRDCIESESMPWLAQAKPQKLCHLSSCCAIQLQEMVLVTLHENEHHGSSRDCGYVHNSPSVVTDMTLA